MKSKKFCGEVEEEFEKLTPEEQQKIALGFRNFGFKAKEWKGKKLASVWNKFANDTGTLGSFYESPRPDV
jgi:hypothetical protein